MGGGAGPTIRELPGVSVGLYLVLAGIALGFLAGAAQVLGAA